MPSEYLTLAEVATLLRFDATAPSRPRQAVRDWLKRWEVPILRRGHILLVERTVIEAVIREEVVREHECAANPEGRDFGF